MLILFSGNRERGNKIPFKVYIISHNANANSADIAEWVRFHDPVYWFRLNYSGALLGSHHDRVRNF